VDRTVFPLANAGASGSVAHVGVGENGVVHFRRDAKKPKQKDKPMETATTIRINLPYNYRHLRPEIKNRGGQFDPDTEQWVLPDNLENQALLAQIKSRPKPLASPQERVASVAKTSVELLNALRVGEYKLREVSLTKIVIESAPSA
jgi:hypothetical protein